MFNVSGYHITMSSGDTGAIRVRGRATLNGEPYTFGSSDRALFSVKNGQGEIVKEVAAQMTGNNFVVNFVNSDTDDLAPGDYSWDVRYIIYPYYSGGKIVDGNQVITPKRPQVLTIESVVGKV